MSAAASTHSERGLLAPLFRQFGFPQGPLGHLAGAIMARENVRANRLVVDLLDVGADDRVLEVGCGPGVAVAAAAARSTRGFVAGVDPSPAMVAQARRRVAEAIAAGRVEITLAPAARLPYPEGRFTRALTVNSVGHWPSVRDGLAELARVLAPGGRAVLALRKGREDRGRLDPHARGATNEDLDALEALLIDAGFACVKRAEHDLRRETLVTLHAHRAGGKVADDHPRHR